MQELIERLVAYRTSETPAEALCAALEAAWAEVEKG